MRMAVIGGTGMAGRHAVDAVRRGGHEPVVLSRSRGVDVTTGRGLDEALARDDRVDTLLPGPDARLAPTTFDAWLATQGRRT